MSAAINGFVTQAPQTMSAPCATSPRASRLSGAKTRLVAATSSAAVGEAAGPRMRAQPATLSLAGLVHDEMRRADSASLAAWGFFGHKFGAPASKGDALGVCAMELTRHAPVLDGAGRALGLADVDVIRAYDCIKRPGSRADPCW